MFEFLCVSWSQNYVNKFITTDESAVYDWLDSEYANGQDVVVQVVMDKSQYDKNQWCNWVMREKDENTIIVMYMAFQKYKAV